MKSIYLEAPRSIRIAEIAEPRPQAGFAMLRIRAVSICGSDVGAYRGHNILVTYPRVIGHEAAAEILEIGSNEQGLRAGDHVVLEPYIYCGECYPCSIGKTNCCERLEVIGVHRDGAMVERFAHPVRLLRKIPKDLPWQLAVLAEPLTIALHSIHQGRVSAGETVTITGAGPIGLLTAMVALHYKAVPILVDVLDQRLDFAASLGIEHRINPLKEKVPERIRALSGDLSRVVIEASGSNQAIKDAFDSVCYAGRIVFTGWPKTSTELPTSLITKKELELRGSRNSVGDFDESIELIRSAAVDVGAIISKSVAFEELPQAVIDQSEMPERFLKIVSVIS
ncbi:MAG: zinc-binding alcohol dehydrogenase family protein [Spirochaetota bacterium]